MISDNSNRKPAIAAAIVASFLMLVFGLTYRILGARTPAPTSNSPLDPGVLEGIPRHIGDWKGQDVPLDEAVLSEIHADACINRLYSRGNGSESVYLFVAASGVRGGFLVVGHPPEICNVWSGSTLIHDRSTELLMDDGRSLPCRILQFSNGGPLDGEMRIVLCYYMADDEFCGNRSVLRSRVGRGYNMVHCIAQVQIAASSGGTLPADSATQLVCDFAADSAVAIMELFKQIEEDQSVNSLRTLQEGGSR